MLVKCVTGCRMCMYVCVDAVRPKCNEFMAPAFAVRMVLAYRKAALVMLRALLWFTLLCFALLFCALLCLALPLLCVALLCFAP